MFQLMQNGGCSTGNFTRGIDIFNADSPDTVLSAGLEIKAKRGNQRAEM